MQRIRMKLAKLQQHLTQTPVTSRICSKPKIIINQQGYNINGEQDRNQEIYITYMYSGPYPTIEQQIQIDAMLLRQFHREEQAQCRERISQLINKKSGECFDQKTLQSLPEQTVLTGDS